MIDWFRGKKHENEEEEHSKKHFTTKQKLRASKESLRELEEMLSSERTVPNDPRKE